MSMQDRQREFKSAVEPLIQAPAHSTPCYGMSNIARMIPGGVIIGLSNLENFSSTSESLAFLSRLSPLPNAELHIGSVISTSLDQFRDRLNEMTSLAASGDPNFIERNNNVSVCLGPNAKVFANNKKISELEEPPQTSLGPSIPLDVIYYSIYSQNSSRKERDVLRGILEVIRDFVGGDKLRELAIWGAHRLLPGTSKELSGESVSTGIDSINPELLRDLYFSFLSSLRDSHFQIDNDLARRLLASLMTKRFVILTGLSGSGKSKLAQSVAEWFCNSDASDDSQVAMVPVGADWDSRDPVLGYPDALRSAENGYQKPANGVLDLILRASKAENRNKPYFLILDEMNLSHVERYLADILSTMESQIDIPLHSGVESWGVDKDVPSNLCLPNNLFIIGTVNIDETTYLLSPKVLDRANVIEFRVSRDEMQSFLGVVSELDMQPLRCAGKGFGELFVAASRLTDVAAVPIVVNKDDGLMRILSKDETPSEQEVFLSQSLGSDLIETFSDLAEVGAEYGYRTAGEIRRFFFYYTALDVSDAAYVNSLDAQVLQKLLPKLNGSIRKLDPVLEALHKICGELRLQKSTLKIQQMRMNLERNGFTSFAEA